MISEFDAVVEIKKLKKAADALTQLEKETGSQKIDCLLAAMTFVRKAEKYKKVEDSKQALLDSSNKRVHSKQTLLGLTLTSVFKRSSSVTSRWNAVAEDLRAKYTSTEERREALEKAGGISAYFRRNRASKDQGAVVQRIDLKPVRDAVEQLDFGKQILVVSIEKSENGATATMASVVAPQNIASILKQIANLTNAE